MDSAPKNDLSIKYVFGYWCFDSRNMAKITKDLNKVVYCTAALGVTMDINSNL